MSSLSAASKVVIRKNALKGLSKRHTGFIRLFFLSAPQGSACAATRAQCTCITSLSWWMDVDSSQAPSTGRRQQCRATLRTSSSPRRGTWCRPLSSSSRGCGWATTPSNAASTAIRPSVHGKRTANKISKRFAFITTIKETCLVCVLWLMYVIVLSRQLKVPFLLLPLCFIKVSQQYRNMQSKAEVVLFMFVYKQFAVKKSIVKCDHAQILSCCNMSDCPNFTICPNGRKANSTKQYRPLELADTSEVVLS